MVCIHWVFPADYCSVSDTSRGDRILESQIIIYSIITLVISSAVFLLVSQKKKTMVKATKQHYRIPDGSITYSDLNIPAKPLFSKRYRISGKPDYIVEKNDQYVPVEVKSGPHLSPLKNHVLQLGTYCQLIEDAYGTYVPHGVLVYDSASFVISFNPQLRFEVSSTIKKIMIYSIKVYVKFKMI